MKTAIRAMALSMSRILVIAALMLGSVACGKTEPPAKEQSSAPKANSAESPTKAPSEKAEPIHWLHDDYAGALVLARKAQKPLVVDMWAPWCHTCLSMKSFVLSDGSLQEISDRFIWVALDTDKEVNAPALTKLPVNAWPTFYVVSPGDESIQSRHLGAASLSQFREFLSQGEGGHLDAIGKEGAIDPTLAAMREGDRHVVYGRYAEANAAYANALRQGGESWSRRPEVLVSRISALHQGDQFKACSELASAHLGEMHRGKNASAADFAYYAHACAEHIDKEAAERIRAQAVAEDGPVRKVLDDPASHLSLDDRSDAMRILREIEDARGNSDKASEWANQQRELLDKAAKSAPDAFARMTYNWPRSEVYVYLGEAEALIPELEASVAALPDQYDPPYRLAWIYLNTGDYDKAVATAEKAVEKVYGPRKARAYSLLADIQKARGDREAERKAREQVVATFQSLPAGQEKPASLERAKKALAAMGDG